MDDAFAAIADFGLELLHWFTKGKSVRQVMAIISALVAIVVILTLGYCVIVGTSLGIGVWAAGVMTIVISLFVSFALLITQ